MQQRGRSRNGWIGWLIFIVFVFGGRFLPPLASWLSQATGLAISPAMLIAGVVGLAVVASLVGSLTRQAGQFRSSNETRLPLPPMMSPPTSGEPPVIMAPRSSQPPAAARLPATTTELSRPRLPSGEQQLPGPPQFEPIIDPRILAFGVLGVLIFGAFLLVTLYVAGVLP